jgi:hypothetical protein
MISDVANHWTRVVRNIVFVEVRLTLVYRLWQKKRLSPRAFSLSVERMSLFEVSRLQLDISTLQFITTGQPVKTIGMENPRTQVMRA